MGKLKLRDIKLIHEGSLTGLAIQAYTTYTYAAFKPIQFRGTVKTNMYSSFSCCTSTTDKRNSSTIDYEYMFIGLEIDKFPSKYRNMELVNKWIDFMNNLLPFFNVKVLCDFKQNQIDPEYWDEKKIKFEFKKELIYFVIVKDYTQIDGETARTYKPLFQLSLLRYFVSSEYWFMIHDCLMLREKKSLAKLSNLDIVNIARFGVQTCKEIFKNVGCSSFNYGWLRDYRSPFHMRWLPYSLNSSENIISSLNRSESQNKACHDGYYIDLSVVYLMHLFQRGHYIKLYNIITDSKYLKRESSFRLDSHLKKHHGSNSMDISFNTFMNINFNIKQYESKL